MIFILGLYTHWNSKIIQSNKKNNIFLKGLKIKWTIFQPILRPMPIKIFHVHSQRLLIKFIYIHIYCIILYDYTLTEYKLFAFKRKQHNDDVNLWLDDLIHQFYTNWEWFCKYLATKSKKKNKKLNKKNLYMLYRKMYSNCLQICEKLFRGFVIDSIMSYMQIQKPNRQ